MDQKIRVALDGMGGDNYPAAPVMGAVSAVEKCGDVEILLCGNPDVLKRELVKTGYTGDAIKIIECSEVIEMAEPPVAAITTKKDSSIVRGLSMIKKNEADAFVSAGSTGAVIAGAQVLVGRVKGIRRSPLATLIPTEKGKSLLIDCGANVDARPDQLVQFAHLGSVYMNKIYGIDSPTVGIVNIGAEDEKGNALVKDTLPMLREQKGLNFIGSFEARDIPTGGVDVLVCEAFTGNIILKMFEGTASMFKRLLKNTIMSSAKGKIGGALISGDLKKALAAFDTKEHGGAPILGLNGLVVKTHGSSGMEEICNSILQCVTFCKEDVTSAIKLALEEIDAPKQ